MVWSFFKSSGDGPKDSLRDYALSLKEKLGVDDPVDDSSIGIAFLPFVAEHTTKAHKRRMDIGYLIYIGRVITALRQTSPVAPEKLVHVIDALVSRIDRGIHFDRAAEQSRLKDFEQRHEKWLESTRPLLDALIPLMPTHEEEDTDGFVGSVYTTTSTLLGRANNPHEKILEVCVALTQIPGSGFRRDMLPDYSAIKQGRGDPELLVHKHLGATILAGVLVGATIQTKTRVPFPMRFEHTHVLGGTGHGKTQFLQSLILKDVQAALEGKGALVVIDGQGDLIRKITRLKYFDPGDPDGLAEKLVLIDANDVEFPVAINMFSLNEAQMEAYTPADRERVFNATISLYEYFFGALLGADLTQRQGLIFKFLARLLFVIPEATIHTFLDVMENGESYRPYMDQLDPTSQRFFKQQFFDKSFDDTKQQIATRLWGVISNSTLNRMFSSTENRFDFFDAINSGKIILINTAKDLLQADGNAIMGRFFIALLARAILQRQAIPEEKRRATFAYIDEIQDYIQNDNKIEDILNQARKYKTGLVCAHQNLEQLSREQRASFAASTTTKFVGGLSAKDARALSSDMRTDESFLLSAKKEYDHTNFACFVKNITPHAIMVPIQFGQMEEIETLSPESYDRLLAENRARYCVAATLGTKPAAPSAKASGPGGFELGKPELI